MPTELSSLLYRSLAVAGVTLLAAGCSDSPASSHDVEPARNFQRILVADASQPQARVISLQNDQVLQTLTLAEPASAVYPSGTGRIGVIQHRVAGRVRFVDGGVWADGGHGHREPVRLLDFQLQDGLPTHENVNGEWISVWFDGSGNAAWLRESELAAGTATIRHQVATGGAHHGGSATLVVNGSPFLVYSPLNPAGGLPTAVEVRNAQGQVVASIPNCPSLHGNNAISTGAVFGCVDGIALVRAQGSGVQALKITPSGDMAGLGLRNAYAASGATAILGQFAAQPGQPTQRVFALINPVTGSLTRLPALPDADVDHWRGVEPIRGLYVFLGRTGRLYIYNSSGQLQHTVPGVVPTIPASGAMTHQIALVEELAAVASPTTGEVVLVNLTSGSIERRIQVGGAPSRLAILGPRTSGTLEVDRH